MADQLLVDPYGDLEHNPQTSDTRIRYYLLNGPDYTTLLTNPDCSTFNFYGVDQGPTYPFSSLSNDAVHIVVTDNGAVNSSTGEVSTGGQAYHPRTIELKNYARAYYKRPSFNNTWSPGRTNNHEIGHLFFLDHTWNCANVCRKSTTHPDNPINQVVHCCDTCYTTNGPTPGGICVSGSCSGNQSPFLMAKGFLTMTLCEHRVWWSERSTSSPYSVVNYCNESSEIETLVYDTGTKLEWNGQRYINADVVIKNGTEVEITCDVFMGADKRIFVERGARLTVNGGSISSLCDYKWQGIIVEGISDTAILNNIGNNGQLDAYDATLNPEKAGTVVLLNASISEAKNGISTHNDQYWWPALEGYFGDLIYCEDAHFFDCDRAVEFMRYGQGTIKDKSQFINCIFEDLLLGVTLWANNGVSFNSCDFLRCGTKAILSYDSEINVVNGCTFEQNLNAIELFSTYPNPFGHTIGSISTDQNIFNNNHYGIYGNNQGGTKGIIIENNRFEDNDFGIFLAGMSHFNIKLNHFENLAMSQEIVACSDDENLISNNYMEDILIPTSYVYKNEGSSFLHNCFVSTSNFDVLLNHTIIFPILGDPSSSAGNCFTKGPIPSIYCNSNEAPVKYYSYGNSTSCYYPIISNCSNVSQQTASNVDDLLCDPYINPIISPIHECTIPETDNDILQGISSYDGLISSTQASTSYTSQQKQDLIAGYKKCQSTLVFKFVEHGLYNPNVEFYEMIDSLFDFLDGRPEFKYKINAYGLKVYSGQYSDASNYLNTLSTSNEEEQDFIEVQKINLKYLRNFVNYSPSNGVLDTLYNIGMKTHPYTGFSRSLYHQLTGELIQLEIPEISGIILPRSSILTAEEMKISSYPNPLQESIYNIELKGVKLEEIINIEIFDIYGKLLFFNEELITGNKIIKVDTENWLPGIYFLTIESRPGIIYCSKFFKL